MKQIWLTLALACILSGSVVLVGVVGASPSIDSTVTEIEVQDDGSAEWTVELRTPLQSDEEVEEYESFKESFNDDPSSQLDTFETRMTSIVDNADSDTERDMQAHSFEAEADIEGYTTQRGVIRFSFVWDGFAAVDDSEIHVGDTFDGGYFISDSEQLRIHTPPGYSMDSVNPDPDAHDVGDNSEVVSWNGPQEFDVGEPGIQMSSSDQTGVEESDNEPPEWVVPLLIIVILGAAGAVYVWKNRQNPSTTDGVEQPEPDSVAKSANLITDEEQVLGVLEAEDRVKQTQIRDELGWSDSKTSRVVSELEDAGVVEKLRIGRENVVRLLDDD